MASAVTPKLRRPPAYSALQGGDARRRFLAEARRTRRQPERAAEIINEPAIVFDAQKAAKFVRTQSARARDALKQSSLRGLTPPLEADPPGRELILHDGHCRTQAPVRRADATPRSEEHTSELQSLRHLVCRLLLEKK